MSDKPNRLMVETEQLELESILYEFTVISGSCTLAYIIAIGLLMPSQSDS